MLVLRVGSSSSHVVGALMSRERLGVECQLTGWCKMHVPWTCLEPAPHVALCAPRGWSPLPLRACAGSRGVGGPRVGRSRALSRELWRRLPGAADRNPLPRSAASPATATCSLGRSPEKMPDTVCSSSRPRRGPHRPAALTIDRSFQAAQGAGEEARGLALSPSLPGMGTAPAGLAQSPLLSGG